MVLPPPLRRETLSCVNCQYFGILSHFNSFFFFFPPSFRTGAIITTTWAAAMHRRARARVPPPPLLLPPTERGRPGKGWEVGCNACPRRDVTSKVEPRKLRRRDLTSTVNRWANPRWIFFAFGCSSNESASQLPLFQLLTKFFEPSKILRCWIDYSRKTNFFIVTLLTSLITVLNCRASF